MSADNRKHGVTLAPNRTADYAGACNRVGRAQRRYNARTWLQRVQAVAAKQHALSKKESQSS